MKYTNYILPFIVIVFHVFVLSALSKVELPEIPERPSLSDLKKSLNKIVEDGKKVNDQAKKEITKDTGKINDVKVKNER